MKNQEKNLRNTVKGNAVFSLLSGIALIIFHSTLGEIMNISDSKILLFVGDGLIVFAISVLYFGLRKEIKPKEIKLIIYQDWGWVIGSILFKVRTEINNPGALNAL